MKVVVYGRRNPPIEVQRVATERIASERDLRSAMRRLSGGLFSVVILTPEDEATAIAAAQLAHPHARVILARGGANFRLVVAPGRYRKCELSA